MVIKKRRPKFRRNRCNKCNKFVCKNIQVCDECKNIALSIDGNIHDSNLNCKGASIVMTATKADSSHIKRKIKMPLTNGYKKRVTYNNKQNQQMYHQCSQCGQFVTDLNIELLCIHCESFNTSKNDNINNNDDRQAQIKHNAGKIIWKYYKAFKLAKSCIPITCISFQRHHNADIIIDSHTVHITGQNNDGTINKIIEYDDYLFPEFLCCQNCRRWSDTSNDLNIVSLKKKLCYHYRRSYCYIRSPTVKNNDINAPILLCDDCRWYITGQSDVRDLSNNTEPEVVEKINDDGNELRYYFYAYMWKIMTDKKVLQTSSTELWSMLPLQWRSWWYESLIKRQYWIFYPVTNIVDDFDQVCDERMMTFRNYRRPRIVVNSIQEYESVLVDGSLKYITDVVRQHHYMADIDKRIGCIPQSYYEVETNPVPYYKKYVLYNYVPQNINTVHLPYGDCTYEHPPPCFHDVTVEYETALRCKHNNRMVDMLDFFDENVKVCDVRCPWGCTEFLFKCGMIHYQCILERYLNPYIWHSSIILKYKNLNRHGRNRNIMKGARNDYLSYDGHWLPSKVFTTSTNNVALRRAIIMTSKGPMVATCERHNKGSYSQYIHPPMNPVSMTFPSAKGAQLTHAVLAPRSVKLMRAHKYNTNYEVRQVNGCYSGIDSCDLREVGTFNTESDIIHNNMLLSIFYRPDLKSLLRTLVKRDKIEKWCAESYLKQAEYVHSNQRQFNKEYMPIDTATKGATFISFVDAVNIEQNMMKRPSCKNIDDINNNGNTIATTKISTFLPTWPACVIWIHVNDSYGAMPHHIDDMKAKQLQNMYPMWILVSLVSNISEMWERVFKSVIKTTEWQGWLLKYITEHVNPYTKQHGDKGENNPYNKWETIGASNGHTSVVEKISNLITQRSTNDVTNINEAVDEDLNDAKYVKFALQRAQLHNVAICDVDNRRSLHNIDEWSDTLITNDIIVFHRELEKITFSGSSLIHDVLANDYVDNFTVTDSFGNEFKYKARFIATRSRMINRCQWKGISCLRHREDQFTKWWCSRREFKKSKAGQYPYHASLFEYEYSDKYGPVHQSTFVGEDSLPHILRHKWNVLVYVKIEDKLQKVRNQYIEALGGQTQIVCGLHHFPLVTSAKSNKCKCSYKADCKRQSKYQCPWSECNTYICNKHVKLAIQNNIDNTIKVFPLHDVSGDDTDYDTYSSSNSDDEIENNDNHDLRQIPSLDDMCSLQGSDKSCTSNDGRSSSSSDSYDILHNTFTSDKPIQIDNDTPLEDMFMMDNITNLNIDEHVHNRNNTQKDHSDIIIPTTSADVPTERVNVTMRGNKRICSHVLNDLYGNCLMRRNSQLKGNLYERGFMQGIISTSSMSVPLLYAEAMLFPDIFWKAQPDGALLGALTGSLWTDRLTAGAYNIAGFHDHATTRITNSSLMCSSDAKYKFHAYDIILNINLRGNDHRMVLIRGSDVLSKNEGMSIIHQSSNREHNVYSCDVIDSRKSVNCLSAMLREQIPTYFVTNTCNVKLHPSLRDLTHILNNAIEHINKMYKNESRKTFEYTNALRQIASLQQTRTWHHCMDTIINYITSSDERPVGAISSYFGRFENQESELKASGILSHFHLILWLVQNTTDEIDMDTIYNRVRCSTRTLFFKDDITKLIDMGIIANEEDAIEIIELSKVINVHNCSKSNFRCHRKDKNGVKRCRYVDYANINPHNTEYGFLYINMQHTDEATAILIDLNFLSKDENGVIKILDDNFSAGKHVYPADKNEHFTPVNPLLFALTRSDQNMMVCGRYMVARYLAKYVAGLDQVARVDVKVNQKDHNLEIAVKPLYNTKITSSKIAAKKELLTKRQYGKKHFKYIGLPEVEAQLMNFKVVYCSRVFINVPTVSLELRPGVLKTPVLSTDPLECHQSDYEQNHQHVTVHPIRGVATSNQVIPSIISRTIFATKQSTAWRQFTPSQQIQIEDCMYSNISIDACTTYSIRPPELFFVNNYVDYVQCFSHVTMKKIKLTEKQELDLSNAISQNPNLSSADRLAIAPTITSTNLDFHDTFKSKWIDGCEMRVLIRKPAIAYILNKYLSHMKEKRTILLFHCLYYKSYNKQYLHSTVPDYNNRTYHRQVIRESQNLYFNINDYIDPKYTNDQVPLTIFNSIRATNASKFFIHILLSLGTFDTEFDLWNTGSIRETFINANLFNPKENETDQILSICKRYVNEQLLFLPAGTKTFDLNLLYAKKTIQSAIIDNKLHTCEIPSCLFTSLQRTADAAIEQSIKENKKNIITAIKNVIPDLPSIDEFMKTSKTTPLHKDEIHYTSLYNQSQKSIHEQQQTFTMISNSIQAYIQSDTTEVQNWVLHGGPGTGKTHLGLLLLAYAIGQGATVVITSILAERSIALGGIHIHKLLVMRPAHNDHEIYHIADSSIRNLNKKPEYINLIQSMDILFIDEIGQVSAQILSVMDIVFRYVRKLDVYMGGIKIICTMDVEQLQAVQGTPFLMNANMIPSFSIIDLKCYVRSQNDENQCRINEICRKYPINDEDKAEFIRLIIDNCKVVNSWTDPIITTNTLRVLGTRKDVKMASNTFINDLQLKGETVVNIHAEDSETARSSMDNWKKAHENTVNFLNHSNMVKEPEILCVYKYAILEFTTNNQTTWSQGQLGILINTPKQHDVDTDNNLELDIMVAPVGIKCLPPTFIESNAVTILENNNWTHQKVKRINEPKNITVSRDLLGNRKQYPLTSRVAATIHRSMGCTLSKIATEVSANLDNPGYIWDKAQVVVLLSRTHYLKDIIFVCRKINFRQTAQLLANILTKIPQYYKHMKMVIRNCAITFDMNHSMTRHYDRSIPVVKMNLYPFRSMDIILPDDNAQPNGYAYVLVSLQNLRSIYIGSTKNLAQRYKAHNKDLGRNKTAPIHLRPWSLVGYVTGFKETNMKQTFERRWQFSVQEALKNNPRQSLVDLINIGKVTLIEYYMNNETYLGDIKYVECGKFINGEDTSETAKEKEVFTSISTS